MDDGTSEWVIYHPPKSVAFGHLSRIRDPRRAWPVVQQFLADLTQPTPETSSAGRPAHLMCYGPNDWTESEVALTRIEEARCLFSLEATGADVYPGWEINEKQFGSAVEFALDDDKYPKQATGPTRLNFYFRFLWKQFERLPYRTIDGERRPRTSSLGVSMGGGKLFLQPTFVFPAPWTSAYLKDFVRDIEPLMPFRIRNNYF